MESEQNQQQEAFVSFNNYDEKGRRIAVFGEVVNGELVITAVTTSRKDQFSKQWARESYNAHKQGYSLVPPSGEPGVPEDIHPQVTTLPIEEGQKARRLFNDYCQDNYLGKEYIHIDPAFLDKFFRVSKNNKGAINIEMLTVRGEKAKQLEAEAVEALFSGLLDLREQEEEEDGQES